MENKNNKSAGVWAKASELKEIDWPLCIRYDGGGAYYYTTVCSMEELQKHISELNPIDEIEWLDESQHLQSQQQNLFQKKEVTLHSGKKSKFFIECDALQDLDIEGLASVIVDKIKFGRVVGIPRGGIKLQEELEKYITPGNETLLICDDVLSSGDSMEEMREKLSEKNVKGVVLFSRGKCPDWITPIFSLQSQQQEELPKLSGGEKAIDAIVNEQKRWEQHEKKVEKYTKEQAYELATLREIGTNPSGTRQDVIHRAMDIYASQFQSQQQNITHFHINDNSDGFRNWLKSKNIDYTPNGHFTIIEIKHDIFSLGYEFALYKQKAQSQQQEDRPTYAKDFKYFNDWWNTLKPQYKTPEIIFDHFKRYQSYFNQHEDEGYESREDYYRNLYFSLKKKVEQQEDKISDEEIEKLAEAEKIVIELAEWSKKYPRGGIYSVNSKMDNELIEIENKAKTFLQSL